MAVCAFDPVDIVFTAGIGKSGVHLLDVNAAMRHLRMARFARSYRAFIVAVMAREAAQSFMHAHGRTIVAGTNLPAPVIDRRSGARLRLAWGVTLVAQSLPWIGACLHRPRPVVQLWNR